MLLKNENIVWKNVDRYFYFCKLQLQKYFEKSVDKSMSAVTKTWKNIDVIIWKWSTNVIDLLKSVITWKGKHNRPTYNVNL